MPVIGYLISVQRFARNSAGHPGPLKQREDWTGAGSSRLACGEAFRVLRPGGRLQMTDLLLHDGVTPEDGAHNHPTPVQSWLRLAGHDPVPAIYGPSGDMKWDEADPTYSVEAAKRGG